MAKDFVTFLGTVSCTFPDKFKKVVFTDKTIEPIVLFKFCAFLIRIHVINVLVFKYCVYVVVTTFFNCICFP